MKSQICCITRFNEENIKVDVISVQQQQNWFDFGVYAIAFMVSLVNKKDLTSTSFDEKSCELISVIAAKMGGLWDF